MHESVPSDQGTEGMPDTLDPQPVDSSSRPLRADFSFPPKRVIRRGFQLAMAQLNRLRRTRWDQPAPPPPAKSSDPHAGQPHSVKRNFDDAMVVSATNDILEGIEDLEVAFREAADTMPAEAMLRIREALIDRVRAVSVPARALENLPLVDPDKAWRD